MARADAIRALRHWRVRAARLVAARGGGSVGGGESPGRSAPTPDGLAWASPPPAGARAPLVRFRGGIRLLAQRRPSAPAAVTAACEE